MQRTFWVIVAVIAMAVFFVGRNAQSSYNQMIELQEAAVAQWGQVRNVYQRRADLIPNVVSTVQGVAEFEQKTLQGIIEARAKVSQLTIDTEVVANPQLMEEFITAQRDLSQSLGRLLVIYEQYPTLRANQSFEALVVELEGSENRISVERRRYNEKAREYNTYIRRFPNMLYAQVFGFEAIEYFKGDPGIEEQPKVEF